eukprot:GFUD01006944.1.p1 GENE.GFUD01006944.1~~GFUD01006944.1.p1  ORF type:complete len:772 (+),score=204.99 GFUD01006944.1:164-2479(+)
MVRALSQPSETTPQHRPGSSHSQSSYQGSRSRPSSSEVQAQRRNSDQFQAYLQASGSREVNSSARTHQRNSSLSQLDASSPSGPPGQQQQPVPIERQRNPPSPHISVPRHNLEAGLAQFELSPATSESGASFELLTLPDFSSLSISDLSVPESKELSETTSGTGDLRHADLPVFLEPGSLLPFSPPQSGAKPKRDLVSLGTLLQSSFHGFSPEDLSSLLTDVVQENRRLSQCLLESNKELEKIEHQRICDVQGFQRVKQYIFKVKKEAADSNGVEDSKVSRKESKKEKKADKKSESKNGVDTNISLLNLSQQLDVAEEAQAQLSQDLQRVTQEKLETQNQLASLNLEYETLKDNVEQHTRDKWEITQVNNDLQQRLQQTVALAHMQAEGNQSRLQEEVGRMLFQLEEERKVTANLSKNLELERRKVESLEQKAKGNSSTRGSSKGERRRSSLLPDEVRDNETRLAQSMELYRQRCDNLGTSLASCQAKLEDERYCGDLTTEVNKLRKLLAEEKKKVGGENAQLRETHALFEQIYLDYTSTIESVKQAQHEKRMKGQQQSVLNNIAESNMRDNVDSMTARLMQAEEALAQERQDNQQTREKLAQVALDLEALPLLQAQVEVYQSDFNAERMARERIAGEKAELEEQLRKSGVQRAAPVQGGGGQGGGFDGFQQRGGGGQGNQQYGQGGRGAAFENQRATGMDVNRGGVRERVNSLAGREQQYDNIPRTVNIRPEPEQEAEPQEAFTCPKCNREFRNTTLLTRHVNDCLDRDF